MTDRETALMNSLAKSSFFGTASNLLCRWHINQNILAHAKKLTGLSQNDMETLAGTYDIMWSQTDEEEFWKHWTKFHDDCYAGVVIGMSPSWLQHSVLTIVGCRFMD